jgi:hypothetical protein
MQVLPIDRALSAMLAVGARASLFFSVTMTVGYPDCQPPPGLGSEKVERSFKEKARSSAMKNGPRQLAEPVQSFAESLGFIDQS